MRRKNRQLSIHNSYLWLQNKKTGNGKTKNRKSINNSYLWLEENREAGRRQGGKIEGKVKHKSDKFWAISRSTETYIICLGLKIWVRYEVIWRGQSNKFLS